MGNRNILFFLTLGILLCLGTLYALRGVRLMPAAETDIELTAPLDKVEHVFLERDGQRIGVVRQEDRWIMTAPFASSVDKGRVQRILDTFESAHVRDALSPLELAKREIRLKDLGLTPGVCRILLEGKGRRQSFVLGNRTPLGGEVYVKREDSPTVFIVGKELDEVLPRSPDDLRSRRLFTGVPGDIGGLEIRTPGKPFIKLVRREDGWQFLQPDAVPAASEKVDGLLASVCTNTVSYFVWPSLSNVMDVVQSDALFKTRLALYGLERESGVKVDIFPEDREQPVSLVFGRAKEDEPGLTYTLLHGSDSIGLVPSAAASAFSVTPWELRDNRLFTESPAQVTRLQIALGASRFVLSQTNRQWRLETPIADVADQTAAAELVHAVISLRADRMENAPTDDGARSHELQYQPLCTGEISFGDRRRVFTVSPDDISNAVCRIRFEDSSMRFFLATSKLPQGFLNMAGLFALHDKTLLSLSPASVRKIAVRAESGEQTLLERETSAAPWAVSRPSGKKIQSANLEQLLAALASFKADRIAKLNVSLEDLTTYGLRKPWLELTLTVESADAVRKTLLVGNSPGFGKRYALVRGSDVLYVLDKTALDRLTAPLWK
ncbi:MAG: DUF4340 domain-containing protein [Kiritimatiellae bacterium]|nr:DUF4340 domain-containing protein [Kiritimatiellia bacterium]